MTNKFRNAAVISALVTGFSGAVAAPTPDSLCVVDAPKSRATIFNRVDGYYDYRTEERTVRGLPLTREVGVMEGAKNMWGSATSGFRNVAYKPQTTRIEVGAVGEYSASSEMYLPNEKKWGTKYEGSLNVTVTGWKNGQPQGYCNTVSGVTGDKSSASPIVPASSLTMQAGFQNVNIFTYKPN